MPARPDRPLIPTRFLDSGLTAGGAGAAAGVDRLTFTSDWIDLSASGTTATELSAAEHQVRYAALENRARELTVEHRLAIRRTETDLTTGLGNRLRLVRTLARRCEAASGAAGAGALLLLGVDRLQHVNDVHGHASGDAVLRMVARQVEAAVDPGDLPVRTAGDEFAVALVGPDAARRAPGLAQRLVQALSRPVTVGGQAIALGVSIGFTTWPGAGPEVRALMTQADRALRQAKQLGRGSVVDHAILPPVRPSAVRRIAEALDTGRGGRMEAWYRAGLELPSRLCRSVRLVPVWRQPDGEARPLWSLVELDSAGPDLHGLLDRTMTQALEAATPLLQSGRLRHLELDLGPGRFDRRWAARSLPTLLRRWGLPAGAVLLRVPEEVLAVDGDALRDLLRPALDLGAWLCVDDFGLGVAGFALLRRTGVRVLCLAPAVVHAVDRQEEARDLVRSVVTVAHRQGLRVAADGVAHALHFDELVRLGIDLVHGPLVPTEGPSLSAVLDGGALVPNGSADVRPSSAPAPG